MVLIGDVLDQSLDAGVLGVDVGSLIDAGEEGGLPVLGFLDGIAAGAHDDEPRHVLILGAEAVGDPGAERGPDLAGLAAVHEQQRGFVVGDIRLHRADDAHVVDVLGDVGEEVGNGDARLTVAAEGKGGFEGRSGATLGLVADGDLLAVPLVEGRLGVKGVDVGGTAVGKDVDDAFGTAGELGVPGREGLGEATGSGDLRTGAGIELPQGSHEGSQAERAHAHAALFQEPAAGQGKMILVRRVMAHAVQR